MARTRSTTSRTTKPLKSKDAARPPSIRGEKRVPKTEASVPVGPPRRRRGTHDGPTDPAAIDRRKEFSGTDQPAGDAGAEPANRRRPAKRN